MARRNGKSLAQTQRDGLIDAVERRGRKTANIWLLREPITGNDLVLVGDLRMEHFFATEGDPKVTKAVYTPQPADGEGRPVQFDAVVDFCDGRRECRHVRRAVTEEESAPATPANIAAKSLGGRYIVVTTRELDTHRQRVQNWQRALAALNRCSHRPLELVEFEILARVDPNHPTTLGELCEALTQDPALLVAATVRLLRKRTLASDLDDKPWSRNTRITRERAA